MSAPATRRASRAPGALRARRKALELSQSELAARVGVSQTQISLIEKGHKPVESFSVGEMAGLLRALRWSAEEFTTATGVALPVDTEQAPPMKTGLTTVKRYDIRTLTVIDSLTVPSGFAKYEPERLFMVSVDAATLAPEEIRYQVPPTASLVVHPELDVIEGRLVLGHNEAGEAILYREYASEGELVVAPFGGRRRPERIAKSSIRPAGVVVGMMAEFL